MGWSFTGNVREAQAVTALPASAEDGDQIILMDSLSAPTYSWLLRYVAAKSSNKWVFIGGSPGFDQVDTAETATGAAYAALTTPGPSFTIPVAGDYIVEIACSVFATNTAVYLIYMSYDIGGTGAVDADGISYMTEGGTDRVKMQSHRKKKTGLAAGTALVSKYKTATNGATFGKRTMSVTPVAIGG